MSRTRAEAVGEERAGVRWAFPVCRACGQGSLVPLSDYGGQGSAVAFKAWVCTEPGCGFNLKIRNGDIYVNEPVFDAEALQRDRQGQAPQRALVGNLRAERRNGH
jgi:hypothetical protein